MTIYYIKKLDLDVDTSKGNGTLSVPPFMYLYNASTQNAVIPGMVNATQHCFKLLEPYTFLPVSYSGYGVDVGIAYVGCSISRTTGQYQVMLYNHNVVVSNDYGISWNLGYFSSPTYTSGICSSHGGQYMASNIKKSSNYGVTWTDVTSPESLRRMCMSSDGSKVFGISGVYDDNTGGVFKSTNYGDSYTEIASDNTYGISDVACSSNGSILAYTNNLNSIFISTDGGSNFTEKTVNVYLGVLTCVCMSDDGSIMYAGWGTNTGSGGIYKSTDTGANWSSLATAADINDIDCSSDGDTYKWVGNFRNLIAMSGNSEYFIRLQGETSPYSFYRSTDGTNYSLIGKNKPELFEISDLGGVYGVSLDTEKLSYYTSAKWTSSGFSEPDVDVDVFIDSLCDYFEDAKNKIEGSDMFSTINLYVLVVTVNAGTKSYVPIFYFGNNSNADRTYIP